MATPIAPSVIASTSATPSPAAFRSRRREPCSSTNTGAESTERCLPTVGSLRHEIPGPFALQQSVGGSRGGSGTLGETTLPEESVSDEFGGGGGCARQNRL